MRNILHDVSENINVPENSRRNRENFIPCRKIHQEVNDDQDDQNDIAVLAEKPIHLTPTAIQSIQQVPAVQRRKRYQIKDGKRKRIARQKICKGAQEKIERCYRRIDVQADEQIQRVKNEHAQIVHRNTRHRSENQAALIMIKITRIDRHRLCPAEAYQGKQNQP